MAGRAFGRFGRDRSAAIAPGWQDLRMVVTEPVETDRDSTIEGTHPLLIVAATVLTVLLLTLLVYSVGDYKAGDVATGTQGAKLAGPASVGACGQGTPADSSYTVDYTSTPDPPRPEGTNLLLTVRHDGKTVTDAKVCVTADMPDMQHPGLNKGTNEVSGGRYETRLQFGMGGSWRMSVTIAEADKPVVAVPLLIQVAQVDP